MRTTLKHNLISYLILVVSIVGGICLPANSSHAQHTVFNRDVIQRWKDYESFSRSIQGIVQWNGTAEGEKALKTSTRYKQNRDCAMVIVPGRDPDTESCGIANPRYIASVRRSTSDLSSATLEKYEPRIESETDEDLRTPIDGAFLGTSPHFGYMLARLSKLVLSPSFEVEKVAPENLNGQQFIRVDHVYTHTFHGTKNNRQEQIRGSLYFDPAHCWCLRRFNNSTTVILNGKKVADVQYEVEYETIDHPSGFPIIKAQTQRTREFIYQTKKKRNTTSRAEYDLEVKQGPPDSEFSLTAFGLPEPGSEPVNKSIPLFVWILVAAGICASLAIGFRYLARRARPKPAV